MKPCYYHAADLRRLPALRAAMPDSFTALVVFAREAVEDGIPSVKVKALIAVAKTTHAGGSWAPGAIAVQALEE